MTKSFPKRKATELEAMMLDELRHILYVHQKRWITPENYGDFVKTILDAIRLAEKELLP